MKEMTKLRIMLWHDHVQSLNTDGVERLADMPLPFLIDLPNGSSEAVFIIGSKNASSGMVPILE